MLIKYLHKSAFPEEKYDAMILIARMYQVLGNADSAEEWAKKALDFKPEIAFAATVLGDLYLSVKRDPALARSWYAHAAYAPHGNVLFDDLPARTYIPHKWLAFCSSQMGDMEKAYYHHKISKQMAPLDSDIRFNDIWFNDNSESGPPVFQQIVSDLDAGLDFEKEIMRYPEFKVFFVSDTNFMQIQDTDFDIFILDLGPTSPVFGQFSLLVEKLKVPSLIIVKEMNQRNLSGNFAALLRDTSNLKMLRNYRDVGGNALFVIE